MNTILNFNFIHIGDQLIATSIPENYFNETGEKIIIANDKIWTFKYNPYVIFKDSKEINTSQQIYQTFNVIPDCRVRFQVENYVKAHNSITANSQAEFMGKAFGFKNIKLRHPRLYIYEDEKIIPDKVVVHTTGADRTRDNEIAIRESSGEDAVRVMSDEVIAAILNNYKDWQIIQVGSKDDKPVGGHSIDRRGQYDYWQSIKEIATSARFIGVNSGPMHMANCYPRVDKRIVLMEFPEKTLMTYKPGDVRNWLFSWIDPSNMFFNKFNYDIGLTYAFNKI